MSDAGVLRFEQSLSCARFLHRPNRFMLVCRLEATGEEVEVHLPDPGRLREILQPETVVWLRYVDQAKRRTKWSAVMAETGGVLVSLDTTYPNALIEKCLKSELLEEFAGWHFARREAQVGGSRWDFLLENEHGDKLLLEVKSVTMSVDETAYFPDAVTARGTKHVEELTKWQKTGEYQTAVLFVIQREDPKELKPAVQIDPAFSRALTEAAEGGVKIYARTCRLSPAQIELNTRVPVVV
ncbi:sugar fermentation stimulation protein A [Salsuginibacillus halophilus]|uniref:Sugar fermentation stimulation protein homolog n=1 Tax=Salsuginibacillus halophilus TaxID=517424 RepID=A0A2P8HG36_9BACI|nr:DNA/RNA nuclease SfsA [Salsuginibacillus halophilus]PSL45188.1 sugar fermentation stimulation protein A [Salsuginibacillus halophilus]